uniref:Exonuclease 3'-5' domain-containing protein 2 n=1 Tax=Graphocephala atropunctata TaxID=36148 RepID=A0A1B6KTR1_9HEMI
MLSKLFPSSVNLKYCTAFLVSLGLTYIVIKDTNIQKYLRFILRKWSYDHKVTVIVSSETESKFAVEQLKRKLNERKVIGLDCEWVSTKGKRHPVALLQLAAPDGFCSLFHLCSLKRVPSELLEILEDKSILKVGVAVVTDAHYLLVDYGVHCVGCLDLRYLAKQVGVEPRGLAKLAKDLFGTELDKSWQIRCSNWESETLTSKQIQYAAQDACIAVEIFDQLNHEEICKVHSRWKRLLWSKKDYWDHSYNLWSAHVGLNYKYRSKDSSNNSGSGRRMKPKPLDSVIKRNYNTLLHKVHYTNIFLLAPDNQVLCTISETKAAWYLEKELVDIVCDDPKTLKLKFEPSNRSSEPDGYYTKPKDNRCVVCGSETHLRRKNVVPTEYRKHFHDTLKNHHSHDVLLLCLSCHTRSNMFDQDLRDQLVIECDAPLAEKENNKFREMPELRAVRSAARALYHCGDTIPGPQRTELQKVICDIHVMLT